MPVDDDAARQVGTELSGRYRLDEVIGEGGMGTVFGGTHLKLGRKVAIKLLKATVAGDRTSIERFFQEARAAASVGSIGVVDVMDLEIDDQAGAYIVMERLTGEPLTELLRRGKLPPEDAVDLIGELLDVLQAVHGHEIVHRDLKPPNVFLHRDEKGTRVVKVLDFGIAKVRQRHLTMTGEIVGTPRFMAPEQAKGEPLNHRTDLYSAGLLLYCCLSGKPPFAGVDGPRVVTMLDRGPTPLRELEPSLPPALLGVVDRSIAPDPARRYESAAVMAAALRASLVEPAPGEGGEATDEEPPAAAGTGDRRARRTPVTLLVLSFFVLALVLGVGLYAFRHSLGP